MPADSFQPPAPTPSQSLRAIYGFLSSIPSKKASSFYSFPQPVSNGQMPGTILLHRDPETKGSLHFQVACEEEKHLIIIQLLNPLRFPPPSSPSSHLAFCFFLFLPKKELRHAEGREPGLVRGKPAGGGGTEMTVRGMVSSQVSGRGSTVGPRGLAIA